MQTHQKIIKFGSKLVKYGILLLFTAILIAYCNSNDDSSDGDSSSSSNNFDLSKAQSYRVFYSENVGVDGRGMEFQITTAAESQDRETNAQTALNAVLDLQNQRHDLCFIRVRLYAPEFDINDEWGFFNAQRAYATWATCGDYHTQGYKVTTQGGEYNMQQEYLIKKQK